MALKRYLYKLLSKLIALKTTIYRKVFFFLHYPLFRKGCGGSCNSKLKRHTSRSSIITFIFQKSPGENLCPQTPTADTLKLQQFPGYRPTPAGYRTLLTCRTKTCSLFLQVAPLNLKSYSQSLVVMV